MLKRVDGETRYQMKEAPEALVEPTRQVVSVAIGKLNLHGKVDGLNRQHAVLKNSDTNRIYLLTRVSIEISKGLFGKTKKIKPLHPSSGLFVEGVQLGPNQESLFRIPAFQAPQDPDSVTKENIFILRGILPESMKQLAEELSNAQPTGLSHKGYLKRFSVLEVSS